MNKKLFVKIELLNLLVVIVGLIFNYKVDSFIRNSLNLTNSEFYKINLQSNILLVVFVSIFAIAEFIIMKNKNNNFITSKKILIFNVIVCLFDYYFNLCVSKLLQTTIKFNNKELFKMNLLVDICFTIVILFFTVSEFIIMKKSNKYDDKNIICSK